MTVIVCVRQMQVESEKQNANAEAKVEEDIFDPAPARSLKQETVGMLQTFGVTWFSSQRKHTDSIVLERVLQR